MLVKHTLERSGWELHRSAGSQGVRRARIMEQRQVTHVLDVGANTGQYATALRAGGYRDHITSFEPLPDAFAALSAAALDDQKWHAHNLAVGADDSEIEFHVSRDSVCSSALAATADLTGPIPQSEVVSTIVVPQVRLDSFLTGDEPVMLKIDTQGYEHHVLDGCERLLDRVEILDVEMALVELYEGGSAIYDLLPRLKALGFTAMSVDPGFVDRVTGQTLDVDVLLVRS